LIRRALQPYNVHRLQYWTIAVGFLIPITLSILTLFNLHVASPRDISPFSFAIGNLVVAWGLFRYGLFDLVPIARERVLETMTDAIIVLDALNRVVDINHVALSNVGRKSAEIIGLPVQEAFAEWPDLVQQILNLDDATLEISAKVQGQALIYELGISPIRDQTNRLIGRVLVAHDITRRKLLEHRYRQLSEELEQRIRERTEELRKSTERYRAVVENQTEFIVRWKPDGVRTFANEAYRRYFGLTPEQTVSAGFMPLVAEEDRAAVQAKVSRLLSGTVTSETEIHRVIKPDGGIGWQEWVDQAIHDEAGQIIEFQSVGRDITERKRIETALQESEKRYRDLVEFSPVAMTVHMEGRIVYINPAGAKLWGADKPDEVLGRSPLDFVHPEYHDRITERIRQIQAMEQSPPLIEVKNTRLDGQSLYTVGTGIPITYEGKPAILSVVLDITERKQAEERMRELTRRLVAAQEEERKRIAQELHDELGQALTAISLDLGGIEKALPPEAPPEIRERLVDARSLADEVDERISELALDLRPSLLDDLGLLPTLQWYLNRYSLRLGIEVALEVKGLESRLPEEVETTLYRVIQEALTNIARHAGAGAVRLRLERSAAAVTASIQDDGRGFEVEEAQSPAASPGGVGLLGIKDRVSTLGGRVDIHSNPGQGVRIQIEIPL
jgi:PAS domain S-box-containing protein